MREMSVDFEAEGLLDGTEGKAREARVELLRELHEDGVSLDELRKAVAGRSLGAAARRAGPRRARVRATPARRSPSAPASASSCCGQQWRALGMPEPRRRRAVFTEEDVEAAKRVKNILDLGVPQDELLEISRLLGITMSQFAAANRNMAGRVFAGPRRHREGDRHALRGAAGALRSPAGAGHGPRAEAAHARADPKRRLRRAPSARETDSPEIAVCFADLVGFTKLGERLEPTELGAVTSKLGELASGVASGPVRIVKLIGDAVMLVSTRPEPLLARRDRAGRRLRRGGGGLPAAARRRRLRAAAISRGGDYYGRPVNLASRITGVARPGSVLTDEALKDARSRRTSTWSFAGERKLKGIQQHRQAVPGTDRRRRGRGRLNLKIAPGAQRPDRIAHSPR